MLIMPFPPQINWNKGGRVTYLFISNQMYFQKLTLDIMIANNRNPFLLDVIFHMPVFCIYMAFRLPQYI